MLKCIIIYIHFFIFVLQYKYIIMTGKFKSKDTLRIDEILQSKGISKNEFADKLGVNRQTLYSFLNRNVTLETMMKIASALDVPVKELFEQPKSDAINCPHCGGRIAISKG